MSRPHNREWVSPHRLEYVPLNSELAVLRVLASLNRGTALPASPALIAGAPHQVVRAPVLGSVTRRPARRMRTADHLLWRVTFALPIELLECPQTLFALVASDHMPTRLPAPELSSIEALCRHWELGPRGASLISGLNWRRAAALGTTFAVASSSVLPPAVALAAGHRLHTHAVHHAAGSRRHRARTAATPAHPVQAIVAQRLSSHTAGGANVDLARHAAEHHARHHHGRHQQRTIQVQPGHSSRSTTTPGPTSANSGGQTSAPAGRATSGPGSSTPSSASHRLHERHHHRLGSGSTTSQTSGSGLSTISPTPPPGLTGHHPSTGPHSLGRADHHSRHRHSGTRGSRPRHHHAGHTGARSGRPSFTGGASMPSLKPHPANHLHTAPPQAQPAPTTTTSTSSSSSILTPGMGMSPAEVALLRHLAGLTFKGLQPPTYLIPIYKKAGKRFHIPWQILAAINSIETDYGRNLNISSAGAVGWMQFMPSTWREYGMSVNSRALPNPYDPTDAIFSAARYLAANGGGHHLRKAVYAYNHAGWYVDDVLWRAEVILEHTARPDATAKAKLTDMMTAAHLLNGLPYVWGGGHGGWGPSVGYDCSGFVSAVLHAAGYLTGPQTTQTLPAQPRIVAGPGKWVTMFDRTNAAINDDHVIIDINGQFWESGGSTSSGGAARVHQIAHISLSYLATFNRILHPQGL